MQASIKAEQAERKTEAGTETEQGPGSYIPGRTCLALGLQSHEWAHVDGKNYSKCARCGSSKTDSDVKAKSPSEVARRKAADDKRRAASAERRAGETKREEQPASEQAAKTKADKPARKDKAEKVSGKKLAAAVNAVLSKA